MTPFWKCLKSAAPKPEVEIYLHSRGTGTYGAYTTGDIIEGSIHVRGVSETELVLDSLYVTFQGIFHAKFCSQVHIIDPPPQENLKSRSNKSCTTRDQSQTTTLSKYPT